MVKRKLHSWKQSNLHVGEAGGWLNKGMTPFYLEIETNDTQYYIKRKDWNKNVADKHNRNINVSVIRENVETTTWLTLRGQPNLHLPQVLSGKSVIG